MIMLVNLLITKNKDVTMSRGKSIQYILVDGKWVDPEELVRYPVEIQWDREGEHIQTLEYHSAKERDAFLSGVEQGNGWDAPDWKFLDPIRPAENTCGKGCCIVEEYHELKDKVKKLESKILAVAMGKLAVDENFSIEDAYED